MTDVKKIGERLTADLRTLAKQGLYTEGIYLQGSQNYGLDDEFSDIDTKAIVIPSLESLIRGWPPLTKTIDINEQGEHIDVKDIREMFRMFKKQNPSYLELLFTPYFSQSRRLHPLREHAEEIARYDVWQGLSAMRGMVMEKYNALKLERPSTAARIWKYGYDPKQLHHMLRLQAMIKALLDGAPYKTLLTDVFDKDYLLKVKRGYYPVEEANVLAYHCIEKVNEMVNHYKDTHEHIQNKEIGDFLDDLAYKIIYDDIVMEIEKNG